MGEPLRGLGFRGKLAWCGLLFTEWLIKLEVVAPIASVAFREWIQVSSILWDSLRGSISFVLSFFFLCLAGMEG